MAIKQTTWTLIKKHYLAGELSLSEIARRYSVSINGIKNHAKRYGWGERPNKGHKINFQSNQQDQVIQDQHYDANKKETIDESFAIQEKHKLLGGQLTDKFYDLMHSLDLTELSIKEKAQTLQIMTTTFEKLQRIERLTYGISEKPKEKVIDVMDTDTWAKTKHLYLNLENPNQDDNSLDIN